MTENKRFNWIKHTYDKFGTIIDNKTEKDMMGTKETCKFMNKQEERITEQELENNYLKKHLKEVLKELYCKDRKLEELGISIECCDDGDVE